MESHKNKWHCLETKSNKIMPVYLKNKHEEISVIQSNKPQSFLWTTNYVVIAFFFLLKIYKTIFIYELIK